MTIILTSVILSVVLMMGSVSPAMAGVIFPPTPGNCNINAAGIAINAPGKAPSDPAKDVPVTVLATNTAAGFVPCEAVLTKIAVTTNNVPICTIDLTNEASNFVKYGDAIVDGGLTVVSGATVPIDTGALCNFNTDPTGLTPAVAGKWQSKAVIVDGDFIVKDGFNNLGSAGIAATTLEQVVEIKLVKKANPKAILDEETGKAKVDYTFEATYVNAAVGGVLADLKNCNIVDDTFASPINAAPFGLTKGETKSFSKTFEISSLTKNTATLTCADQFDAEHKATADVTVTPFSPKVFLDKKVKDKVKIGEAPTYTFDVKNTGDLAITNCKITDQDINKVVDVVDAGNNPIVLNPNDTWPSGDVLGIPVFATFTNTATVECTYQDTGKVTAKDSVTVTPVEFGVNISKICDDKDIVLDENQLPGTVDCSIKVWKNPGSTDLSACVVTDTKAGSVTTIPVLSVDNEGAATSIPTSYKYTLQDVKDGNGVLKNTATVECITQGQDKISKSADASTEVFFPKVFLDKKVKDKVKIGEAPTYTFDVKNTGDLAITNCKITDLDINKVVDVVDAGNNPIVLNPNDTWPSGDVLGIPVFATFTNTATVECTYQDTGKVTAKDSVTVTPVEFGVNISKNCDDKDIVLDVNQLPGTVDCSIKVWKNPGSTDLSACVVTDTKAGSVTTIPVLSVDNEGAATSIPTSYQYTLQDVKDGNGVLKNTATVECITQGQDKISKSADASTKVLVPKVEVSKVCEVVDIDGTKAIQWNWEIKNTSPDMLTSLAVTADGTLTLPDNTSQPEPGDKLSSTVLAWGESKSGQFTTSGTSGKYTNKITATADYQDGKTVSANAEATCQFETIPEIGYFVGGGRVDVDPSADGTTPVEPNNTPQGNAYAKATNQKVSGLLKVTHGFELHCDKDSGPNNLEVNWLGNQFHLEELELALCYDDGSVNEPPPSTDTKDNGPGPTLDVYYGEGYGRFNGVCGAHAQWVFDDNGEPGKADHIVSLLIKDADGKPVLTINSGEIGVTDTSSAGTWKEPGNHPEIWADLVVGNHQWVPHPADPHGPLQTNPCEEVTK